MIPAFLEVSFPALRFPASRLLFSRFPVDPDEDVELD